MWKVRLHGFIPASRECDSVPFASTSIVRCCRASFSQRSTQHWRKEKKREETDKKNFTKYTVHFVCMCRKFKFELKKSSNNNHTVSFIWNLCVCVGECVRAFVYCCLLIQSFVLVFFWSQLLQPETKRRISLEIFKFLLCLFIYKSAKGTEKNYENLFYEEKYAQLK